MALGLYRIVTFLKAEADISDAILKKHDNSLDHSNDNDHVSHSDDQDLSGKVDKITGKGLSTNDYTTAEQTKLAGIAEGANNYTHPANHPPSIITQDASNRLVSDVEKSTWNGKEPGNTNIQTHVTSAHAPSTAQKNSDITKEEIEAKLIGAISSHSHSGGGSLPCPICIPLFADAAATAWANMPAALTEFRALTINRTKIDLTGVTQARLIARVTVTGATNAELRVQYSTNESTWLYLDGVDGTKVNIYGVATKAGAWISLATGAKADVFLRLVGINGDAAADPAFGLIMLQVK